MVATQTLRLATLIEEELARQTTVEQPRRHHVWEWLTDWTDGTGIRLEETGRGGDGQIVEFDEPWMAGSILRVVWEEQPIIHESLLTWLGELCEDEDHEIQRKAAEAVGLLATYDFSAIRGRFLERWCNSPQSRYRDAAAWTLASAAKDPNVAQRVFDCLNYWAHGNRNAKLVVIQTYGSWLGAARTDHALHALTTITATPSKGLAERVANSVSLIHQLAEIRDSRLSGGQGDADNTTSIVATLRTWSEDAVWEERRRAAALAFVRLLASPDPLPVIGLASNLSAAADLVALWRLALVYGVARETEAALTPEAWSLLSDWLGRWDTDLGVRGVLSEILTQPPDDLRMSLSFHLRLWGRIGKVDTEVAARLAALVEGS